MAHAEFSFRRTNEDCAGVRRMIANGVIDSVPDGRLMLDCLVSDEHGYRLFSVPWSKLEGELCGA